MKGLLITFSKPSLAQDYAKTIVTAHKQAEITVEEGSPTLRIAYPPQPQNGAFVDLMIQGIAAALVSQGYKVEILE